MRTALLAAAAAVNGDQGSVGPVPLPGFTVLLDQNFALESNAASVAIGETFDANPGPGTWELVADTDGGTTITGGALCQGTGGSSTSYDNWMPQFKGKVDGVDAIFRWGDVLIQDFEKVGSGNTGYISIIARGYDYYQKMFDNNGSIGKLRFINASVASKRFSLIWILEPGGWGRSPL
jgi:hypothetical protein